MKDFYEIFKALRKDKGWTIKEVQSHPLYDQHPEGVVIIEKVIYE